MVLSELSLVTMLIRALLCPPRGHKENRGHVSGHEIGTTPIAKAISSKARKLDLYFDPTRNKEY